MFATKYNHRALLRVYEWTAKAGAANTSRDLHQEAALADTWCDEVNHLAQSLFLLVEEKFDADKHQLPRVVIATARMLEILRKRIIFLRKKSHGWHVPCLTSEELDVYELASAVLQAMRRCMGD